MYHTLLEELREINIRLIDTELTLSEEDADSTTEAGESILVKCTFKASALSPGLKAHFTSSQLVRIVVFFFESIDGDKGQMLKPKVRNFGQLMSMWQILLMCPYYGCGLVEVIMRCSVVNPNKWGGKNFCLPWY